MADTDVLTDNVERTKLYASLGIVRRRLVLLRMEEIERTSEEGLSGSKLNPDSLWVKTSEAPPTPVEQSTRPLHIISAADIPKASGWIEGKTPI